MKPVATDTLAIEVARFKGVKVEDVEAAADQLTKLLNERPHLRYLQRLSRLDWLAQKIDDPEVPVMLQMKCMEMLSRALGDYKQEAAPVSEGAVLIVHDNGRGGNDDAE